MPFDWTPLCSPLFLMPVVTVVWTTTLFPHLLYEWLFENQVSRIKCHLASLGSAQKSVTQLRTQTGTSPLHSQTGGCGPERHQLLTEGRRADVLWILCCVRVSCGPAQGQRQEGHTTDGKTMRALRFVGIRSPLSFATYQFRRLGQALYAGGDHREECAVHKMARDAASELVTELVQGSATRR